MQELISGKEGHRARLRERFIRAGLDGFSDYEIVELVLTLCIPRRDVKPMAKQLLIKFGDLRGILDAPLDQLIQVKGIGSVTPAALKIIKSVSDMYLQQHAEQQIVLNSSEKIERFWLSRLGSLKIEVFEVAYLDSSYKLMKNAIERLEEGIVDRTQVYPRKVIEAALKHSASGLVLAHNHPTGKTYPSEQDKQLTKVLQNIANSLSIRIVDHLIITRNEVFSFRRAGLLN